MRERMPDYPPEFDDEEPPEEPTDELREAAEAEAERWLNCEDERPFAESLTDTLLRFYQGDTRRRTIRSRLTLYEAFVQHDVLQAQVERLREEKHGAYAERNRLVAALSKVFPSFLARTEIEGWDPEWEWCVYINGPTGQVSWHIRENELPQFDHLERRSGTHHWDGHTTEEKYARLAALTETEKP